WRLHSPSLGNTFVYAACTRLGAIRSRTVAVLRPYWQRRNLCLAGDIRQFSYLFTLVTESDTIVPTIRPVSVRVRLGDGERPGQKGRSRAGRILDPSLSGSRS